MKISIYEVKRGTRKLIGLCETTMQNLISSVYNSRHDGGSTTYSNAFNEVSQRTDNDNNDAANNEFETNEKDFLLQRSHNKLKEVGRLRILAADIVSQSGRFLTEPIPIQGLDSIVPMTPPQNHSEMLTDDSPLTNSPATPTTIPNTPSPRRTVSSESTTGDPFTLDLKHFLGSTTQRESPYANTITISDYIESGGQLDFCVAIDFTSSNGE